jgi:hypothetical protein
MTVIPPPPTTLAPFGFGAIPPSVLSLKAAGCVFDLCQFQSYISIKDQMIRAHLISEWLASTGVLGAGVNHVLVVGAGVAGVCTGVLIAEYGLKAKGAVKVTLVDGRNDLFTAQETCDSRFVSLTQYDWPGAHYNSHAWPNAGDIFQAHIASGTSFRLTVPASPTRASDLVKQWRDDFAAWHTTMTTKLIWRPNTIAVLPSVLPSCPPVRMSMSTANTATQWNEYFDLVIVASGFAQETVPKIGGVNIAKAFWEHDDYADPGVSHAGKDFAIVGNGDGALQDFLRLVCDPRLKSVSAIVDRIEARFLSPANAPTPWVPPSYGARFPAPVVTAPTSASPGKTWLRMLRYLADIDRQATLVAPWDSDNRRGMADLQADVEWIVHRFASTHAATLVPAIDAVLRSPADALGSITLVAPNPFPSKCYMLNRFLFTLIKWRLTHGPAAAGHPRFTSVQEKVDASQLSRVRGRYRLPLTNPLQVDEVVWRVGIGRDKPVSLVEGLRVAIGKHALPFYPPNRFR